VIRAAEARARDSNRIVAADASAIGFLPGLCDHLLEDAEIHVGELVDVEAGLARLVLPEPLQSAV
jgi:hypothetical protein